MKRLAFLALAVLPAFAPAATGIATISFTRPTTYSDGSALPASAITGYAVDCQFTPTGGAAAPCTLTGSPFAGSVQSGNVTITYPPVGGSACFSLRTLVGSLSSVASAASCKTFDAVTPSPPTNVVVTVSLSLNLSSASPITVVASTPVVTQK